MGFVARRLFAPDAPVQRIPISMPPEMPEKLEAVLTGATYTGMSRLQGKGDLLHFADGTRKTFAEFAARRARGEPEEIMKSYTLPVDTRPRRFTGPAHAEQLAKCGRYVTNINPFTGANEIHRRYCGNKDCPTCGARRGREYATRIHGIIEKDQAILMITLSDSETTQLVRSLGKENYLRMPQADGANVVFFKVTDDIASDTISRSIPVITAAIDWTTLQCSPNERIPSGNLGKAKPADSSKTIHIVTLDYYFPDRDHSAINYQATLAMSDTLSLDPRTPDDLQQAISRRQAAFSKRLSAANIAYETTIIHAVEKLSPIDWMIGIGESFHSLMALGAMTPASFRSKFNTLSQERQIRLREHPLIKTILAL